MTMWTSILINDYVYMHLNVYEIYFSKTNLNIQFLHVGGMQ
jgi:hypothetical protein